jgi:hypothetical protein
VEGDTSLHEVELAWALVDVIRDSMNKKERIETSVAIGVGDTDTAIRRLVAISVRRGICVPQEIAGALRDWWAAYGEDDELDIALVAASSDGTDHAPTASHEPMYLSVRNQCRRSGFQRLADPEN